MARRLAEVAPYRRMMPFLMRGRNESVVYFEQILDVSRTQAWLDAWNAAGGPRATIFHVVLHALADMFHARPRLNRYVVGRRLYERGEVTISFAAKKRMTEDAPLATVKRTFPPGEPFATMMAGLENVVEDARSSRRSQVDKELDVFLRLPAPLLDAAIGLLHRLDAWGIAPRALTDSDPMYASAFVANLGSLHIDAAYHHLYEHGNCPLFVAIGQVRPRPVADGDQVVVRPTVAIRYTYDERIEDGLYCAAGLDFVRGHVEDPGAVWGNP